jgi:hypothetical protein
MSHRSAAVKVSVEFPSIFEGKDGGDRSCKHNRKPPTATLCSTASLEAIGHTFISVGHTFLIFESNYYALGNKVILYILSPVLSFYNIVLVVY